MYFALTMLSTVGYGDFYPVHRSEMLMSVLLMLMGVGVFSWITSELRAVILHRGRHKINLDKELKYWVLTLDRFPGMVRESLKHEIDLEL